MNYKLLIFVAFLFAAVYADDKVLTIDGTDAFNTAVAEHQPLLVKFYAPWCGHCKKLAAPYEEAAGILEGTATLIKVDCTTDVNKDVCGKYGVKGFPTLKIFDGDVDKHEEYGGGRTADAIVDTMKKAALPAWSEVADTDTLDKIVGEAKGVVAVFYNANGADNTAFTTFATANKNTYTFVIATDASLAGKVGANDGDIWLLRNFDSPIQFEGTDVNSDDFKTFLTAESFPPLGEIGPDTYQAYVDRGLPIVWCFVDYKDEDKKEELFKVYESVARQYKGKLSFVQLDGVQWDRHAAHYGITDLPGLTIEDMQSSEKFLYDASNDHLSANALGSWVAKWESGDLTQHIKSEPVPDNSENNVKVIVGDTWSEFVENRQQDIFVEYYAPWCGHCKKLAPTWDELGDALASHSDKIVIAKIDATANDFKENVSGFPTLYYYPKDGAKEKYAGAREFDDLLSFIEKKAGITVEKTDDQEGGEYPDHDEL